MFYKVQLNFSETDLPNISVLAIGKKIVRTVRVNGQIIEVKQLKIKANSKMGDHLGTIDVVFSSLAMVGRNIRQISQVCQILLINLSFRKTQMFRIVYF